MNKQIFDRDNLKMTKPEKEDFSDKFIDLYLSMGFGSLPKREIDLFVFHFLIKSSEYKNKSNYELSNKFQVPESKIKSMRLYSALKYDIEDSDTILKRVIKRLVKSEQYLSFTKGQIEISLEDPIEKRELEHYLKRQGHHAEYTLNSEVLKIEPIRLLELIMEHVDKGNKQLEKMIQENIEDQASSARILADAPTLKQKFNKLREEVLTISTLKSLIGIGYDLYTTQK